MIRNVPGILALRGGKESIKGLKIIPRRMFCDAGQFAVGDNLSGRLAECEAIPFFAEVVSTHP